MKLKRNRLPAGYWKNPVHLVACGFGTGASPYAPGTAGTLVGIVFFVAMHGLGLPLYLVLLLLLFLGGIWFCERTAKDFGVHDHSGIVWDEVVGYLVGMIAMPLHWFWIIAGFFVFRFYDVFKPFPIRRVDLKVKGGFGIMFDDVLAGIYTLATLHAGYWLLAGYAPAWIRALVF